jgi:hypothetical protein
MASGQHKNVVFNSGAPLNSEITTSIFPHHGSQKTTLYFQFSRFHQVGEDGSQKSATTTTTATAISSVSNTHDFII